MECTQRILDDAEGEKQQVATLYILGTSYPIFTGVNNIGRDIRTSHIFIDDQTVSQSHAVIRVNDHKHIILDLASTNKTVLEAEGTLIPYDQYPLKHKASLKFGNVSGQYFYDEIELESQIASPLRPTNPMEKLLEANEDQSDEDYMAICSSPILDSSLSKKRLKDDKSKFSSAFTTSVNEISKEKLSNISIHEMETQLAYENTITACNNTSENFNFNNNSDRLILSESLHDDTKLPGRSSLNHITSFFVPETQDIINSTISSSVAHVSIAESDKDYSVGHNSNKICDSELNEVINYQEDSNSSHIVDSSQCLLRSFTELPNAEQEIKQINVINKTTIRDKSDEDSTDCEDYAENSEEHKDDNILRKKINFSTKKSILNESFDVTEPVTKEIYEIVKQITIDKKLVLNDNCNVSVEKNSFDSFAVVNKNNQSIKLSTEKLKKLDKNIADSFDISNACTQKIPSQITKQYVSGSGNKSAKKPEVFDIHEACTQKIKSQHTTKLNYTKLEKLSNKEITENVEELWNLPTQKNSDVEKPHSFFKTADKIIENNDIFNQPTQVMGVDFCDMPTQMLSHTDKMNLKNTVSKRNDEENGKICSSMELTLEEKVEDKNCYKNNSSKTQKSEENLRKKSIDCDSICDKTTLILQNSDRASNFTLHTINSSNDKSKIQSKKDVNTLNISSISEIASDSKTNYCNKTLQNDQLLSCVSSTPMVESEKKNNSVDMFLFRRSSDESLEDPEAELMAENSMKIDAESLAPVMQAKQIFGDSSENESTEITLCNDSKTSPNKKQNRKKKLSEENHDIRKKKHSKKIHSLFSDTEDDINSSPQSDITSVYKKNENNKKIKKSNIGNSQDQDRVINEVKKKTYNKRSRSSNNIVESQFKHKRSTRSCLKTNTDNFLSENTQDNIMVSKNTSTVHSNKLISKVILKELDAKEIKSYSEKHNKSKKMNLSNSGDYLNSNCESKKQEESLEALDNNKIDHIQKSNIQKTDSVTKLKNSNNMICRKGNLNSEAKKQKRTSKRQRGYELDECSVLIKKENDLPNTIKTETIQKSSSSDCKNKNSAKVEFDNKLQKMSEFQETRGIDKNSNMRDRRYSKRQLSNRIESQNTENEKESIKKNDSQEMQNKMETVQNSGLRDCTIIKRQFNDSTDTQANEIESIAKKKKIESKSTRIFKSNKNSTNNECYKVLMTSVTDPTINEHINVLGGLVVDDHNHCSVLIAPRIIRTVKFLCCLGKGIPIVSLDWVHQSLKANKFLDPWDFITTDKVGEAKYKFDLKTSLKRAQTSPLLKGYTVMGTINILPQPKETKEIVHSCGGKFITSNPRTGFQEPALIISCEEDKKHWHKRGKKYIPPVVTAEALLIGVLQQKLNISPHILAE